MMTLKHRWLVPALLGIAWCLLLSSAPGQVTVNVDWQAVGGQATARHYGLNLWNGTDKNKAANTNYQANVEALTPGVARFHAAEMIQPGHSKAWIDTAGNWKTSTIDSVLTSLRPHLNEVVLNVPDWHSIWDALGSNRLDPSHYADYANYVASLVNIANNQLGHNVQWIEVFNERDNSYNGDSATLAAIHNQVVAAVRAVDPNIKIAAGSWIQPFDDIDIQAFLSAVGSANMDAFSYHHYATFTTNTDKQYLYDRASENSGSVGKQGNAVRGWLNDIPGGSGVELWLGETNLYSSYTLDTQGYMRGQVGAVWDALMHATAIERGAIDVILPWNDSDGTYGKITSNGNSLNPAGNVRKLMVENMIGDWVTSTTSDSMLVDTFAVVDGSKMTLMLTNRSGNAATVNISGIDVSLLANSYTRYTVTGSGIVSSLLNINGNPLPDLTMAIDTVSFLVFEAAPSYAAADFNHDGSVDGADLALWQVGYGILAGANKIDGDADQDGDVDGSDYLVWQRDIASVAPPLSAVLAIPEPLTASLIIVVFPMIAFSRSNFPHLR